MNLWKPLTSLFTKGASNTMTTDQGYGVFAGILGGGTRSGVTVNRETAMQLAVVFSCLRVLSEGVAQVPFKLMKSTPGGAGQMDTRLEAREHPLFDVLHRKPNGWMTSFDLRSTLMIHAALADNGYAYIAESNLGARKFFELLPLDPSRVRPEQLDDWTVVYHVAGKDGVIKQIPSSRIWHLRGLSLDGLVGVDVLKVAREAMGLAIATERTHAALHSNGVKTSGVYSVEGTLTTVQFEALNNWVKKNFTGNSNAGVPMILDRNAKWSPTTMTGVDAQHVETRRHQIEEICRFFRVLPIMIGYSGDKTPTYASAEQLFMAHVVHTLMPWYERIQQSADTSLLTDAERAQGYYVKLFEAGLLRGAMRDMGEFMGRMVSVGVMTRNEARAKLDSNPIDGLDEPLTPVNMTTSPQGGGPNED